MRAAITYKGETLETLNGGEYVTLHTKGKRMEDDILVEVAEGGGSGAVAITVAANVSVCSVTANVETDVSDISTLSVTEGE